MRDNTAKHNMITTVIGVLDKHALVFDTNVGMKADVVIIKGKVVIIDGYESFDNRSIGTTAGKNQKFDLMINGTFKICNSGVAYGSRIDDQDIIKSFDYSLSDLQEGKEKAIHARCKAITEAALPIETILKAEYNLPVGHLTAQVIKNNNFFVLIDAPGKIIEAGKSVKEETTVEYHAIDLILSQRMDKMVYSYKDTNPDFYLEYHNARKIGGYKKKKVVPPAPDSLTGTLHLNASSSSTGLAILGAIFTILSINFGAVTDVNGEIVNEKMLPGTYTGRLTCDGYTPIDFTFIITKAMICELGFMMEEIQSS